MLVMQVFLDSKKEQRDDESSPALVNVAQSLALKEMSRELRRSWVLTRSMKTASGSVVGFLGENLS